MGRSRFYIHAGWGGLKWILCAELDHENKTVRSHYNFLLKLTEIYWRSLSMTGSYSVQNSVARPTYIKSRTLELKSRFHTIKFYQN